jgi:NAD(P)-dependent dehydrogenase (short-subunit alcohol dehydrogenase family)
MPHAIVTGGSRGLGLALTAALVESGWRVLVDARGGAELARATAGLPRVTAIAGDIADPAHRRALVEAAADLGGLDLLVNNAGILGPSPLPSLAQLPSQALRELYETNVLAPLALTQLALPLLRTNQGALVNITSDAAVQPYAGWGAYGSTKAAWELLGAVLAVEEPALTVWTVDPGDLRTRMHQDAFPGEDISDRPLPESVAPGLLRMLDARPSSGRYRLADWLGATQS